MNQYWPWIATCMIYNTTYLCFWSKRRQNESYFVHIVGLVGRKCWGWSGNTSLIPTPLFINLTDELMLSFHWYLHDLQHIIPVFWSKKRFKKSDLLQIMGLIGRKRQGWSGNTSMIPALLFINFTYWWTNIDFLLVYVWSTTQHTCRIGWGWS